MDHDGAPLRSLVARSRQREHAAMTMRQARVGYAHVYFSHPSIVRRVVFLQDTFHTRVEILSRGVAEAQRGMETILMSQCEYPSTRTYNYAAPRVARPKAIFDSLKLWYKTNNRKQ